MFEDLQTKKLRLQTCGTQSGGKDKRTEEDKKRVPF